MDVLTHLSAQLGAELQKHGYKLALAESCTGGMVSAAITEIAGSSDWFERGFITYSNASKQELLNVAGNTLAKHGAVSEETAKEMALGALKNSHANIAASITGIAGPSGGSEEKPVGTVCFALSTKDGHLETMTEYFKGSRQEIRHQAAIRLITRLISTLAH